MTEDRLLRAMLYAERHLGEPLDVECLARVACISDYHFHRMFHLRTGEPVMEFVRRIRLEHAAYRLRATRRAVAVIAREVGYASADAFGRAFRARFGCTPRDYRQLHHSSRDEAAPAHGREPDTAAAVPSSDGVVTHRLDGWTMLCFRRLGPYQEVHRAWAALDAWIAAHHVPVVDATRIGISHDDPALVAPARIRYDACRVVTAAVAGALEPRLRPPLHVRRMPAGDYAVTRHVGAYHELDRAYRRLFLEWLPGTGRYPADAPVVERYHNSPRDAPPTELVTDLLLPLE